eukprot:g22156.t1
MDKDITEGMVPDNGGEGLMRFIVASWRGRNGRDDPWNYTAGGMESEDNGNPVVVLGGRGGGEDSSRRHRSDTAKGPVIDGNRSGDQKPGMK